jgi:thymidylate synthase (FAD)
MNSRIVKSDSRPPTAIPCFNEQGFIALLDHMGDDRTVVNAARVSFGKRITEFDADKDSKLLDYLAANKHMSPFRHPQLSFHLKAPEAVMRQAYKHVVGIGWTPNECPIKDHA